MTDAIVKYQMTLMTRLSSLEEQIESIDLSARSAPPTRVGEGGGGDPGGLSSVEVQRLLQRISSLESGENKVKREVEDMQGAWLGVSASMREASVSNSLLLSGKSNCSESALLVTPALPLTAGVCSPDEEEAQS